MRQFIFQYAVGVRTCNRSDNRNGHDGKPAAKQGKHRCRTSAQQCPAQSERYSASNISDFLRGIFGWDRNRMTVCILYVKTFYLLNVDRSDYQSIVTRTVRMNLINLIYIW